MREELGSSLPKLAYTVDEAAQVLGVSKGLVYRLVKADEIPHKRLFGKIVIPVQGLRAWLAEASSDLLPAGIA